MEGLVRKLSETLSLFPGWCLGGISNYNEERETVIVFSFAHHSTAPDSAPASELIAKHEDPAADSRLPGLAHTRDVYISPDLRQTHSLPVERRLFERGARRFVSAPLLLQDRILGDVFLAFADPGQIHEDVCSFLEQLARHARAGRTPAEPVSTRTATAEAILDYPKLDRLEWLEPNCNY